MLVFVLKISESSLGADDLEYVIPCVYLVQVDDVLCDLVVDQHGIQRIIVATYRHDRWLCPYYAVGRVLLSVDDLVLLQQLRRSCSRTLLHGAYLGL